MEEHPSFAQLIQRVRAGEMSAAEVLVRHYEPVIRRAIRVRLVNPALRRTVDSVDICQSVMGSFFVRAALGQYDLDSPEQLAGLLIRLARNKVADVARRAQAEKRDLRRVQHDAAAMEGVVDGHDSPSQMVAGAELLQKFREKLQPDELLLADRRAEGREWNDLAAELGENGEALRKRLRRAVDRVARELGLEEMIDEA
jgi:DNA-directed RNA polymerase specialized sigma24 family protein